MYRLPGAWGGGDHEEPLPGLGDLLAEWSGFPVAGAWPMGTTCVERQVWSLQNDSVVAGGGAIEMELSKYLRDYSRTIPGKQQLLN